MHWMDKVLDTKAFPKDKTASDYLAFNMYQ